jgi:hypothetical protein
MILSITKKLLQMVNNKDNNKTKNRILVIYFLKNVIVITSSFVSY